LKKIDLPSLFSVQRCFTIDRNGGQGTAAQPIDAQRVTPHLRSRLLPQPTMPIPQSRTELYQFLLQLPDTQFNQVLFHLKPPPGNISPAPAPRGQRVPELFTWLESIGPDLEALRTALEATLTPP